MRTEFQCKEAFNKGLEFWNEHDFINSRKCFEISIEHPTLREKTLYKLIQIELREGKYVKARCLLEKNDGLNSVILKPLYGLLESIENNFELSKKYYSECMVIPDMQFQSLLAMAKLYVQTGDYLVARKMYETLQLNVHYKIQATTGLINLEILQGNYKEALELLKTINHKGLTPKLLEHYRHTYTYLMFMLGRIKEIRYDDSITKDYMLYRLFDQNEETLLAHISKHTNQEEKYRNGCFFKYIDLKKLLVDAKEIIKNMNANHFELSDMYRFRLDTPIGFKENQITSDLCVVTMIGTKDIVTMYPVQLSDEFDKEGFSINKQITLKRKQGGVYNG